MVYQTLIGDVSATAGVVTEIPDGSSPARSRRLVQLAQELRVCC